MIDVFNTLNVSKKKDVREKVVCNCYNCVKLFKYDQLYEPKVQTFELDRIRKMSSIVVVLPTNLIPV